MLRWCQTTVQTLEGCVAGTISNIRFYSSLTTGRPVNGYQIDQKMPRTPILSATPGGATSLIPTMDRSRQCLTAIVERRCIGGPRVSAHVHSKTTSYIETGDSPALIIPSPMASTKPIAPVPDSLATLHSFLSLHNASPKAHKISINDLISIYASAKAQSQLSGLSSKQLTKLLSLFGTLSLPSPKGPCIYFSNLVPHVEQESASKTRWSSVLEIAQDKERLLGQVLNGTDRYWAMRAQLAKVAIIDVKKPVKCDSSRLSALSQATLQYLRIWRHTPDPEIHVPYFEALLSLSSKKHISDLVHRICKVLELHTNPHSRIVDILWQVLLRHGQDLTLEHKDRVLSMISSRLVNFNSAKMMGKAPSALKIFDATSKRHKLIAQNISALSSSFNHAIFPSYSPTGTSLEIRQWAATQASQLFNQATPRDIQWRNLLLLAIYNLPRISVQGIEPMDHRDTGAIDWRTILTLATLERTLTGNTTSSSASKQGIQDVVRTLWRTWKGAELKKDFRSMAIARIIVATFFRLAAKVADAPLVGGCHRFCIANDLFTDTSANTKANMLQLLDLRVAYILATVVCEGRSWQEAMTALALPGVQWSATVEALLYHYSSRDADAAFQVYLLAKENGLRVSDTTIYSMSTSLATSRNWHLAVPFLRYPGFSREQLEHLLAAILRVFQVERWEFVRPALVQSLGEAMWSLYAHGVPSERFKYPIRFFFPIMVASGYPSRAISVVEAIHHQMPRFFTTRFFLRLTRTLIRYRHIHLTSRVLHLAPSLPTRTADDFRRKLTLGLARAGAHVTAQGVYRLGIRRKGWRTAREALARAVSFKVLYPSTYLSLKVVPILARSPSHGPTIKYAVAILVRANRTYAARKLLERTSGCLDSKTKTSIGNIILHGFLQRHVLRNGRLVRHTLRIKEMLEKTYGFLPDRVTINIIIKTILRWRHAIDPSKVRALFDHMVRCGYPASSRWCQEDVPFGTPSSSSMFNVPALSSTISFERHVRPLYKMFIKAFYARHDTHAAKTVIGILKEEEVMAMRRREDRNRARRLGLIKKQARGRGKNE